MPKHTTAAMAFERDGQMTHGRDHISRFAEQLILPTWMTIWKWWTMMVQFICRIYWMATQVRPSTDRSAWYSKWWMIDAADRITCIGSQPVRETITEKMWSINEREVEIVHMRAGSSDRVHISTKTRSTSTNILPWLDPTKKLNWIILGLWTECNADCVMSPLTLSSSPLRSCHQHCRPPAAPTREAERGTKQSPKQKEWTLKFESRIKWLVSTGKKWRQIAIRMEFSGCSAAFIPLHLFHLLLSSFELACFTTTKKCAHGITQLLHTSICVSGSSYARSNERIGASASCYRVLAPAARPAVACSTDIFKYIPIFLWLQI